jgi:hypothetical protein
MKANSIASMPSKKITKQISQQFSFDEIKLPHREVSVSYNSFFLSRTHKHKYRTHKQQFTQLLMNAHYKAQKYLGQLTVLRFTWQKENGTVKLSNVFAD